MKIEEIADCRTGLVLKRYEGEISYRLLSSKYIDEIGCISNTEEFMGRDIPKGYQLEAGDIVMKIAAPNTTVYISEQWAGAVLSSFFFLIRVKDKEKIDPRFLTVYFNSPPFREEVEQTLVCSTVKALKISTLKQLEVPDLSMEKQKKLVSLAQAMQKEEIKRRQLQEKQHLYYRQLLTDLLKEK